jgi:hypothetical protein
MQRHERQLAEAPQVPLSLRPRWFKALECQQQVDGIGRIGGGGSDAVFGYQDQRASTGWELLDAAVAGLNSGSMGLT